MTAAARPADASPGTVYVIAPDSIDDSAQPSGGNIYDRRICRGLADLGWSVRLRTVPGRWPTQDIAARAALAAVIAAVPDGGIAVLDGLIASTVPQVLVPEATRVRLVILVHMPLGAGQGDQRSAEHLLEGAVLAAATVVVVTSAWTGNRLVASYSLPRARVRVVEPGADRAEIAAGTPTGVRLLCVAAVTPVKGHDVLVAALATLTDLSWHCTCIGSTDRDPAFADRVRRRAAESGLTDRLVLAGARTGADLDSCYAGGDLLVLASRAETYGMVVGEALARGIPVVATAVGGVPEALGAGADGSPPGLLVPAGDSAALARALRRWLGDPDLRQRFRQLAGERRLTLPGWADTAAGISSVLAEVAA